MTTSKYLSAFKGTDEAQPQDFRLIADCIMVEEIPPQEVKTAGGLVLSSSLPSNQVEGFQQNRPVLCRVLKLGAGYYDEDTNETVPLEVNVGDVILVGRLSVNWFSHFGSLVSSGEAQIGYTREQEIKGVWPGVEAYERYFAGLNQRLGRNC